MARLVKKGELKQEKREVYYYLPTVSREEYGSVEVRRLAEKVYGGGLTKLVASFVEGGEFSESELDELRAILDRLGREKHEGSAYNLKRAHSCHSHNTRRIEKTGFVAPDLRAVFVAALRLMLPFSLAPSPVSVMNAAPEAISALVVDAEDSGVTPGEAELASDPAPVVNPGPVSEPATDVQSPAQDSTQNVPEPVRAGFDIDWAGAAAGNLAGRFGAVRCIHAHCKRRNVFQAAREQKAGGSGQPAQSVSG